MTRFHNFQQRCSKVAVVFIASLVVAVATVATTAQARENVFEAVPHGVEAYIYGYPLVTMEMTRRVMTNVEKPEGTRTPSHSPSCPDIERAEGVWTHVKPAHVLIEIAAARGKMDLQQAVVVDIPRGSLRDQAFIFGFP